MKKRILIVMFALVVLSLSLLAENGLTDEEIDEATFEFIQSSNNWSSVLINEETYNFEDGMEMFESGTSDDKKWVSTTYTLDGGLVIKVFCQGEGTGCKQEVAKAKIDAELYH